MKVRQADILSPELLAQSTELGEKLNRLRIARRIRQGEAALRAGLSRTTVYRIERGEPGVALGQVLRYLDAVAPGTTLLQLLSESDPALVALAHREQTRRVRELSAAEREKFDF